MRTSRAEGLKPTPKFFALEVVGWKTPTILSNKHAGGGTFLDDDFHLYTNRIFGFGILKL